MSRDSVLIRLFTIVGFAGTTAVGFTALWISDRGRRNRSRTLQTDCRGITWEQSHANYGARPLNGLGIAPLPDTAQSRDTEPRDSSTRLKSGQRLADGCGG